MSESVSFPPTVSDIWPCRGARQGRGQSSTAASLKASQSDPYVINMMVIDKSMQYVLKKANTYIYYSHECQMISSNII